MGLLRSSLAFVRLKVQAAALDICLEFFWRWRPQELTRELM